MTDIVPLDDSPRKQCATCKEWFPLTKDYFHPSPEGNGGFRIHCTSCVNAARRQKSLEDKLNPPVKEILPDGYKRCPKCKEVKLATTENFFETRKGSGKFRRHCKDCINKQCKAYVDSHLEEHRFAVHRHYVNNKDKYRVWGRQKYAKNPESARQRQHRYRVRHHARLLEKEQAFRRLHPEKQRGYSFTYRQRHPELVRGRVRAHRQSHREHTNVRKRNYYARKKQSQGRHTIQDILNQYERQKGRCYWCSCKLGKNKHEYHVDHIVPLTRGGSNDPDNLVIACPHCNTSKHNKLPHEWIKGGKLL